VVAEQRHVLAGAAADVEHPVAGLQGQGGKGLALRVGQRRAGAVEIGQQLVDVLAGVHLGEVAGARAGHLHIPRWSPRQPRPTVVLLAMSSPPRP